MVLYFVIIEISGAFKKKERFKLNIPDGKTQNEILLKAIKMLQSDKKPSMKSWSLCNYFGVFVATKFSNF